jgi:hypothetical protein
LSFSVTEDIPEHTLIRVLQTVDRSFHRTPQTFRAANRDGYLVDLIRPMPSPPWKVEPIGTDSDDLISVELDGLQWHQSAPSFESVGIDQRGEAFRMVATDPRVWAIHKFWLSKRQDRDPIKRGRDDAQARAVADLVSRYLIHLPVSPQDLRMLPKDVVGNAAALFTLP